MQVKNKEHLHIQNNLDLELQEFLNVAGKDEIKVTPQLRATSRRIEKDLVKSNSQIAAYYLMVSLFGYLVSLTVCAQNALGISDFSQRVAMSMCALSQPWCWIACGAIFTGTPFVASLFILNRFQQRYLLFKMWWLVVAVPVAASILMAVVPTHLRKQGLISDDAPAMMFLSTPESVAYWLLAAVLTPYVLEILLYLVLRQRRVAKETV